MSLIKELKIGSFFAGIGGIDLGFEQAELGHTVYMNEFDKNACKTLSANFPDVELDPRDICTVEPEDIPDMDIILGGFPCQAFSIAGYRKGFDDERGTMFFELLRLIKAKQPQVILLENVKNLQNHDKGKTFKIIKEALETEGYHIKYKVLNASEYGNVAQNRERIYIVGFKNKEYCDKFNFPEPIELSNTVKDIIDFDDPKEEKYQYWDGKYKGEIYTKLVEAMDDPFAIYQWRRIYARKNMSGVVPTLTANMGSGGHNVPIVKISDGTIRKMTPRECLNAQGFPQNFVIPPIADGQLYKQAGNSVCIPVIKRIAEEIKKAML